MQNKISTLTCWQVLGRTFKQQYFALLCLLGLRTQTYFLSFKRRLISGCCWKYCPLGFWKVGNLRNYFMLSLGSGLQIFFDMYSYKPANEVRLCFVKKTLNNERSGRCFSWECVTGKSLMVTTLTRICIWILKITKFDGECTTKKQLPYSWKTRFLE